MGQARQSRPANLVGASYQGTTSVVPRETAFGMVPFVSAGGGFGGAQGALVQPGTYMMKLVIGTQTFTSSVDVLEDIWMRPQ